MLLTYKVMYSGLRLKNLVWVA